MKILHLLASPYFSGPAEAVALLAQAQRALGHEVAVAVDRKRVEAPAEELAVPRFEALGLASSAPLELSVKSTLPAVLRDLGALRRLDADVVHSHFSHDHLLARLASPRTRVVIRSVHSPRSLRWSLPAADAYTVPSEELTRALLGLRVLVLPALVDAGYVPSADRAGLRVRLGLPAGPLVGMVSTFQPSRRHALGVQAFRLLLQRVPGAHLVLVGDGALRGELERQVAAEGLGPRVRFAGYRSGADFLAHLQALDEVWVLGLGNDFAGRAAAQARACGVRVVAVDEGALASLADAVVPPGADAIAAAALQDERRRPVGESTESVARRVLALYDGGAR